jgi:hypothetical protein
MLLKKNASSRSPSAPLSKSLAASTSEEEEAEMRKRDQNYTHYVHGEGEERVEQKPISQANCSVCKFGVDNEIA